jgi:hypothetical protein
MGGTNIEDVLMGALVRQPRQCLLRVFGYFADQQSERFGRYLPISGFHICSTFRA